MRSLYRRATAFLATFALVASTSLAGLDVKQSGTAIKIAFPMISSTDGTTPVYGITPSVSLSKNGGLFAAPGGTVAELNITTPTGLTVTPTGTAGSMTYGYRISAVNSVGETLACAEVTTTTGNATLNGINYNALSWAAVTGAASYNVYGRTAGAELKMTNVSGTTYNDTLAVATPAGALPAQNTTSGGWYALSPNSTDTNTVGDLILHATGIGAANTDRVATIVAYDPASATNLGLSAIPTAAPNASGGLMTFGSGAGQINPASGKVPATVASGDGVDAASIKTTIGTAGVGLTAIPSVGAVTGAVASVTGAVGSVTSAVTIANGQIPVKKNAALNNFTFPMLASTDHLTPLTGLTVTGTVIIDGAAPVALTNSIVEVGSSGVYKVNFAAADTNGGVLTLKFTATGADTRLMTIITQP